MDYEKKIREYMVSSKVDQLYKSMLINLFPELAESEDEKIRRWLYEMLKAGIEQDPHPFSEDANMAKKGLAWLEKQGEHAKFRDSIQVGDQVTRNEDGVLVNLSQLKRVAKQGEQKPVEHLELKAGHWYICHRAYCCRADHLTVKEGERFMCEKDGVVKGFVIKNPENYFKEVSAPAPLKDEYNLLWSEEDESNRITIVGELLNSQTNAKPYENATYDKLISWVNSIKDRCLPQQQEWSEEDKYLLSSCISIFERIGDGDLIKGNKDDANKFISFLKSLRPQKQQYDDEWSDEDKDFLKWTLNNLAELKDRHGEDYGKVGKCIDWLNSLQPQPIDVEAAIAYQEGYQKAELEFYQKQQEWTDEDINMIDWLIRCCEKEHEELCNDKYGHQDIVSDLKRDCRKKWNWLESLKEKVAPQKQWKPSKEQIKAFEYCIDNNCCDKDGVNGSKMVELYQQLKAL